MLAIPSSRCAAALAAAVALACSCSPASSFPAPEALSSQSSALGGPDLWVQSVVAPPSALPSSAAQVTVTVCNQGDSGGEAPVWILRSSDALITLSDQSIGASTAIGFLLPGACNTAVVTANVPGTLGNFYLGAFVDPANALVEANEANNAAAPPKATAVGSKPDFVLTSVSGPASALQATSIPVSATLCNQGTQPGTTALGIYLSTDANITTGDTLVGQLSAPPSLAPGACATLTGTATTPNNTAAYWLGAIADRTNTVSELLENNNALAGNQLGVGSKPDFIVTAISGPPSASPGASFSISTTLCNQGTQPGSAPVTIYLSTDATITSTDVQVAQLPAPPSLAPGACTTLTGPASASVAAGTYWLGAMANASLAVAELIKTNDAKAGSRMGVGDGPDFFVTSVSAAPTSTASAPITVTATVCNQGTQAGNVTVGVVFSYDDTITPSDTFAGLLPTSPFLLPGACDVVSGTVGAPSVQGFHYAGAIADYYGTTSELLEDNNAKAGTRVAVGNGPDLVVTSVSAAPSATPGTQVTVTATTCNQGTQPAFAKTTLYFSTDATITTADLPAADLPAAYLLPGECTTDSTDVWGPPAGVYTVGAIADAYASVAELWETNNATAGNLLAVGNGPDFVLTSVSSSASALPGGSLQVAATLCNRGTLGASAPTVEVFFSTDATITAADLLGGPLPPAPFLDSGACATLSGSFAAPPAGTYFAGAIADRAGSISELVETNNSAAGTRFVVGSGPDLVVTALSTGVAASPGAQMAVAATVCNQGTQGSYAPVDLFFSTDRFISTNDWLASSLPAPWLEAGTCTTVTGSTWAPGSEGTYFIAAFADDWNGIAELAEDNNIFVGSRVGVGNAPDFSVKSVSTAPSALPGAQVTVTTTVCNQGTVPSSVPVSVYFSSDGTITTNDFFAGLLPPFNFLLPGACEVLTGTFPAPPQGTYRVGAIADAFSSTPELFEDNNWLAGNAVGVGSGPDFIISSVSTAASALPGSQVQVTTTVCNQGTLGSNAPLVEIFFSADATITGSDFYAGLMANAPFLDPGSCATQTRDVPLPGPAGTYFVGAIADRGGSIPELMEGNNATAGNPLAVGNGPDFAVTSVTSVPSATPGGSIQVTATLCNLGTQGASPPVVEAFFSRDTTITGDDFFAGPMYPPPPYLNPGECATLTSYASVPPQPGTYYAGAIVDRFQSTLELREDNNATAGNRIGVDFAPDFVVASVSTAATVMTGGMLEVEVKVCNQGTQGSGAPLDIYFSTDDFVTLNDTYSTSIPMPFLNAGECSTVIGTAWAPGTPGTYSVGAIVNAFGNAQELFTDNNALAGNRVGVGNLPDFYVESVSTAASALPGGPLSVTAKVCNRGTVPGSVPVGVYFSTDATITNADFFGGVLPPFNFLLPGSCEVLTSTFPAPPPGAYFVGAIADDGNSTAELFEDNNWKAGNRVGVGSAPDFIIASVSTASSALPWAQVTVAATLCNQGTVPGSAQVDLFFSTDATITTSDALAWSIPPSTTLDPGACTTVSASVTAPAQGTYWVGAIADAFGWMNELVEDNNWKAGNPVAIGNGPDFAITSITSAPSATPGGSASVAATLCNLGTQGAYPPVVEVFFSRDTTITSEDFFAGPMSPPPPYLNAGECATLTSNTSVPPMPGIYSVGGMVDRFEVIPELREDNNTIVGNRIGVDNAPDFVVASVSTAATVSSGGMLEVEVKVCNQGTQGGGAPLDIYFSSDDFVTLNDTYSTSLPMPLLNAGECTTVIGTAWAPGTPGTYSVGAIVNAFGSGQELFKDNNSRAGNRVGVGNAPDFYVESVSTAASVTPGGLLSVTTKLCNRGTVPGSVPVGVYFSTDAAITNTDFFGGMLPPFNFLLPGGCEVLTSTFPAPPPGTYWVGAIADDGNSTPELFEDNNWKAGNRVAVGTGADFVISSVSSAPSALPGAQVTVASTLCNQGTAPGSAQLDLFFSTDATITTSDALVWGFPPVSLQPGECATRSATVGAPPLGTYWVGAIADAFNAMPELVEDNNWKAGNQLVIGNGPDFAVTSITSAPSATPGGSASVTATLCNLGTQGAYPPVVEVFFSRDATITSEDFFAGPMYPPPPYLASGECATLTSNTSVPPMPGTYYAGAMVDRFEVIPELREDNNTIAGNRIAVDFAPDFYVESVSTVATVASGGMLEVAVKVCNQGTQGGGAPLDIYFSSDDFVTLNDTYSTSLPMPLLNAGECTTVIGTAWAPGTPGTYYVGAIVNAFGNSQELFKDNNAKAGNRVGVGNLPDFYLKSVSTSPSALPGGPLTVSTMICNQGTVPGSVPVSVYFSTDATITNVDLFAGVLPPIPFILPGGCDVVTATFPAPPPGAYWVGAIADDGNSTPELYEDNNALAGNRFGVGGAPDFVISSVSTAPSALPGAQVTITTTLCNQGTIPASTPVDLFFSTDATITTSDQLVWGFPPAAMLAPGDCTTLSANVGAPPPGTYWVGAIADSFGSTNELLEDNNWKAGNRMTVGNGPDFTITAIASAPSATPGGSASVTATLCNHGAQGAYPPVVEAFFSRDTTITSEDFFAGPLYPPPPYLNAGECATLTSNVSVPPMPGTYFVGGMVDRFGAVAELREDNNVIAGNRIGVDYAPDFYVASVSTAVTAKPGGMLQVEVKVCNQGSQGGGAPLDVYFSSDDYIALSDTYSTSVPMPLLNAGECSTVIGTAWSPGTPGTYYVGAIVNAFGNSQELFKDNNAKAGNRVGVGNLPDFYVESVSTAASALPGGQLTVTVKACNRGTVPGSAPMSVYFSTDATITNADFFSGVLPPIPFILPGGCDVVTATFPAPPPGAYWVGVIVDDGNSTPELYEDNNWKAGNRVGAGSGPDFVISSVSTAPSALPGAQVTITTTLCNQGTATASGPVDLFFSTDATITTSDQLVWGFPPQGPLAPGACTTLSANVVAPPPGTYWVGAIADSFGSTNELIEDNNWRAGNQVTAGNGPDFVVTSVTSAPSATPGGSASVAATLCNQGTQGANPPVVEVYFSRDGTITSEDFRSGPLPPAPFLAAGACATLTGSFLAPPNPGTYFAGTITDGFGAVAELREDNNATAGSRIGVDFAPDYLVTSVSTSVSSATPGSQIQVTVTACNQGTQGGNAPLDVYFSTDSYIAVSDTYSTSIPMPFLAAGGCATVVGTAWTPGTPGTYSAGAIVNAFGNAQELFTDNNSKAGATALSVGP